MGKALGLALALTLALSLSALAEQTKGKVKAIDAADHSFVLEDGTKLWVSEGSLTELTPGDQVQAVYEMQGGKKVVTDLERRTTGPEGQATTNFGSNRARSSELQAPGDQ